MYVVLTSPAHPVAHGTATSTKSKRLESVSALSKTYKETVGHFSLMTPSDFSA